MSTIEFDGQLKAFLAKMDDLPVMIEAKLVRGALRAAAKPMKEAAQQKVPVGAARVTRDASGRPTLRSGGDLKKSIRVSSTFKKRTGEIKVLVKAGNYKAWYAHLVEHGAKAHLIKGPIRFNGKYISNLEHPGFVGKPFMRPAFDSSAQAVVDAYAEYMKINLPKFLEKYGKR
jgi:HK97 gp10 family phage protein